MNINAIVYMEVILNAFCKYDNIVNIKFPNQLLLFTSENALYGEYSINKINILAVFLFEE